LHFDHYINDIAMNNVVQAVLWDESLTLTIEIFNE
jgi:hypothetical protein